MRALLLIILFFGSVGACAQDQRLIDSLQAELKNHNARKFELGKNAPAIFDTTAANILYELSKANWYSKPDTAITFANRSKIISEKIGYKKGVGFALYSIGVSYVWKSNFPMAIEYTNKALKFGQNIGDKKLIASAYTNLGKANSSKEDYPEALQNILMALKIAESISEKQILMWNYGNLSDIYTVLESHKEALKYVFEGLKIAKELNDQYSIVGYFNAISYNYIKLGRYSEAISYQLLALEICKDLKDSLAVSGVYYFLGNTYQEQGNYTEALKYFFLNQKYAEKLNDKFGLGYVLSVIGEVKYKQKSYFLAIDYLNKGLKIAKEMSTVELIRYDYETLAKVYSEMAVSPALPSQNKTDFALKALENYKLFIIYRDSIINVENTKKITQLQMQFDFDKRELATKAEQDKKQALANAEISKQKIARNFSFAGIFGVLLMSGYGFYRYRKNKRLENHQSLLNERLRISRELHDDMGSTLSSISVYSEVAKNRASKNKNETEVLSKIGTASRELIEKMSDIVWSLNPNNENFEQLKNRMMAFAAMMLAPKGILFEFDIDDEVKSASIAPEQRKNIFLIYKEAINNIVKYSEATSVKVKVKVKENKLSLEVIDNGKGFDTNNIIAYNGNGLKNMKARAEEIKALFNVTSRINEGTGIELSFNV